jgi:2-polyprenyl-3-methyl-5-hydroxy-6-metoxy-1,4-benzoquinol methylase
MASSLRAQLSASHGTSFVQPRGRGGLRCRICLNSSGNARFVVHEMMFGFGDAFIYFRCSDCGCLQIRRYAADLARYYGPQYYAHSALQTSWLTNTARRLRAPHYATGANIHGALLEGAFGTHAPLAAIRQCRRLYGLAPNDHVLDVGCGDGRLLANLTAAGFTNLLGIDPFISASAEFARPEIRLVRKSLYEVEGRFDLIIFNHSLEHMPDQAAVMERTQALLTVHGIVLIRTPIVSYAFERYGPNWFQLDAPRHLYVHSETSLRLAASKAGLALLSSYYDSTGAQYFASEAYESGLSMHDMQSRRISRLQTWVANRRAVVLNRNRRGDQGTFFFGRSEASSST